MSAKKPAKGGLSALSHTGEEFNWTEELLERLFAEVAGGASIRSIAGKDGLPVERTIYRKMGKDPSFAERMTVARASQQDLEMDRCVEMADAATIEDHQVVKLRIWARQWRASKLAPKKYGDKLELGGDLNLAHTHLTLDQLRKRVATAKAGLPPENDSRGA